jgi:four helix bundle protein
MAGFRFEDLEVWKEGIEISDLLFDMALKADEKKHYRFAEQLRGAGMSITNNIAEGSGSNSDKEFSNFLNMARRSVFECANIIILFERRKIIELEERKNAYKLLLILSKRITNLRKSLIKSTIK